MFGDNDLGVFFGDFGVPVQFGGATVAGILDQPEKITLADRGFGGFDTTVPTLKLPYNAFSPMPTELDSITINGQNYSITEQTAESDGAVIVYSLKGPTA